MHPCHARLSLVVFTGAALASVATARAADLRPSWECLPDDTAVMIHVPRPAGFLELLRTRTKFGAVVLGADRLERARALAVEAWGGPAEGRGSLEDLERQLATVGLEVKDLEAAFTGDMGYGIVMRPRDDDLPPVTMALAWMEPGGHVAERMVTAFHRLLEDQADDDAPPQRVDLEMAGQQVTWVAQPIMRADLGDVKIDGEFDAERLAELREELAKRATQAPKVRVGTQHVFLARMGGRLLAGQTLPPVPDVRIGMQGVKVDAGAERAAAAGDLDRISGSDEAREIFARYLAAHAAADGSPLADVLQTPGVRAALPGGEPLGEIVLDPRPLLAAATADDARMAGRLAAFGVADVGPVAMRLAFDGGLVRQGTFVTLPAPRAGLMRILDQDCDAAEVPSFVTIEAADFTQISLDLAAAYRTVKEFATAEWGEQAANMFMTAEMQGQGWLGVELEAMLANLGSRHWIITYPPQGAAAIAEARRNQAQAGLAASPSADRVALVWKLADDAPVVALLPKVAALAQSQVVEEQGFRGVRLPGGSVSVFVGQGHLVVGMGGDALEKTLAGIRNPPAAAASLRESDVPRKAADLVGLGPARLFSMGDATRTGGMLGELRDAVIAMVPDDVEQEQRDLLTKLQALMPSTEEMQGMFGVGATVMEVNDAGIALESAWEMPAP
jgi:hypothetical protein